MLVTGTFVYLHLPKTGGTFVATTLARIHHARGGRVDTLWIDPDRPTPLPPVAGSDVLRVMLTRRNQHGTRRDIPAEYADRPALATIRNPYDRYVSQYEFAWWRADPTMFGPVDQVRQQYPTYPDLTFAEFVHLANSALVHSNVRGIQTPGFHTQQFFEHFFIDPDGAYRDLSEPVARRSAWDAELEGLRFLDQRFLNEDLHGFLLSMGYPAEEIAFVLEAGRIRPLQPDGSLAPSWVEERSTGLGLPVQRAERNPDDDQRWRRYCDREIKAFIREKERWLFECFPQFDV